MRYWIGVVGTQESKGRLLAGGDTWWCVSENAAPDDLIAMYMTRAASEKGQGVFAIYRISAIDAKRKDECRAFGSMVGGTFHFFALISPVRRVSTPVTLQVFRKDATLFRTPFVRRNAQGTLFEFSGREFQRLEFLCGKAKASDGAKITGGNATSKGAGMSTPTPKVKEPTISSGSSRKVTKTARTSTLPKITKAAKTSTLPKVRSASRAPTTKRTIAKKTKNARKQ